jgi:hypothetical protein
VKGLATESILSRDKQVVLIMELQQHSRKMLDKNLLIPSITLKKTVNPIPPSASLSDNQRNAVEVCGLCLTWRSVRIII